MMTFHLTAPSKTFLLGEYVALQGGPTLVLTSQPCFKLTVKYKHTQQPVIFEYIDKESPAGKYLLLNADLFKGYHLIFHDPHNRAGGFGASSAQFLLVNTLTKIIADFSLKVSCQVKELLTEYQQFAWDGEGMVPSGADLIAQAQGGVSYFYKEQNRLQVVEWPFEDINYYLLHTGNKIATHQHLKELTFFTTHQLMDIVFAGFQHLQTKNAEGFVHCIKEYAQALQKQGWVCAKTEELLTLLNACPQVLAAKGCGALGADVILVLANKQNHFALLDWLKAKAMNVVTHGNKVGPGLQITTEVELSI